MIVMLNKLKKIAVLLFILSLGFSVKAQPFNIKKIDFIFREEYAKLKEQHIDTFITYHRYCEGIMAFSKDVPSRCYGFRDAFILWKSKGGYYIKRVVCYGEPSEKVVKISSNPFDAYFNYLPISRRCEKYKDNAVDILPRGEDGCSEELTLISPKINYQINIAELQKTSKEWQRYSWIRANLEIIRITRAEIDKAIAEGLSPTTP
jgi:hypothetical protein